MTASAPQVTVAIPCRNAGRWIGAAVRSALEQQDVTTEVIVVDDGSTDHSREEVCAFGDRVRLLPGAHRGANVARNLALREAAGEWIQFLDADDYLLPHKIASQLRAAADADVIYSPVIFDQDGAQTPSAIDPQRRIEALCRKDPLQVVEVRTELYRDFIAWLRGRGDLREAERQLAGQAFFEMARTTAKYDLARATRYHQEHRRDGLICPTGPAAPASYRTAYSLLGFPLAERLARLARR